MRLNFSHATYEEATLRITNLRKAQGVHTTSLGSPFNLRAVLLDIQGPKIRTGSFVDGAIEMTQGREYVLTTDEVGVGGWVGLGWGGGRDGWVGISEGADRSIEWTIFRDRSID
jgi:pyruvate kinase